MMGLLCHHCGGNVQLVRAGQGRCEACGASLVVSVSDAYPRIWFNRSAPFAGLVVEIDNMSATKRPRQREDRV